MKELGYGEGYLYDPDEPGGVSAQGYLPEEVSGRLFYRPGSAGFEQSIGERLDRWREQKEAAGRTESNREEPPFPRS
jgi:putative ATPase